MCARVQVNILDHLEGLWVLPVIKYWKRLVNRKIAKRLSFLPIVRSERSRIDYTASGLTIDVFDFSIQAISVQPFLAFVSFNTVAVATIKPIWMHIQCYIACHLIAWYRQIFLLLRMWDWFACNAAILDIDTSAAIYEHIRYSFISSRQTEQTFASNHVI